MLSRISLPHVFAGFLILALAVTSAAAACYVCDVHSCELVSGDACSNNATIKICEEGAHDAQPGETGTSGQLQPGTRGNKCWEFINISSSDWYAGPCSAGPPGGIWYQLPSSSSCGTDAGQCCWTKTNWTTGGYKATKQISDCEENVPCPVPAPH